MVCHDDRVIGKPISAPRSSLAALAALASSPRPRRVSAAFKPGAKSLGDPIFPQIGNGGYDVRHYAIDLDYDPPSNELRAGDEDDDLGRGDAGPVALQPRLPARPADRLGEVDGVPAA